MNSQVDREGQRKHILAKCLPQLRHSSATPHTVLGLLSVPFDVFKGGFYP